MRCGVSETHFQRVPIHTCGLPRSDKPACQDILRNVPWSTPRDCQVMTEGRAVSLNGKLYFRNIVEKALVPAKSLQAHPQRLTRTQGITQDAKSPWPN